MESPGPSTPPATIGLVRADLAEMWAVDLPQSPSPRIPAPAFGASDFIDFDVVEAPKIGRPNARRDPLPDMLAGALTPTPAPESPTHRRKRPVNYPSSKRKTALEASPANSTIAEHHQQRESNNRVADVSAKGKARTKQAKILPETGDEAPSYIKTKRQKHSEDVFEISDSTDGEGDTRPQKRQAKRPSPKSSRAPNGKTAQTATADDRLPVGKRKRSSRTSRLQNESAAQSGNSRDPEQCQTLAEAPHVPPQRKPEGGPRRPLRENTSAMAQPDLGDIVQVDLSGSPFHIADDLAGTNSSDDLRTPPPPPRADEPAIPAKARGETVINSHSHASQARVQLALGSTSPLSADQISTVSRPSSIRDNHDIAHNRIQETRSSGLSWPSQQATVCITRQAAPPPSQPRPSLQLEASALSRKLAKGDPKRRVAGNLLPRSQISQPEDALPSANSTPKLDAEGARMNPQNIWTQAVMDDSPPAILHRIVTLLHRSLKPKEEVVRDIVGEYQEKASLLLENMRTRHHQEKSETLSSLWKASSATFTVLSIAEQEMKIIIDRLHDLDLTQTLASFKRTDLMEKLDTVARLCQARASNYTADENRAGSEAHENEGSKETDDGSADSLVENYRLKLEDGIRQPDDETSAAYRQLSAEADMFITQCLQGGRRDNARPDARPSNNTEKKTKTANRTTDDALEEFLDRIINTLQESTDGGSSHPSCDDDRKII
ncbi:hypothetical protein N656DRAFT_794867 [Canariomyces notabilis]|uniref:Uncharacterized protein n=1 Tax=Canariomyces notabilis TaxID=2074819 RepID=A0AAN6YWX8_9PEZI|nr:hypothetical protein N656DRAFT_794867 [Canariomyces arenarius]